MADTDTREADRRLEYLNFGILSLRPSPRGTLPDEPMTVVVTGVGRSGTSMLATTLSELGIPMGRTSTAVYEDEDIQPALFHFDHTRFRQVIGMRNAAHLKWGFKFPSIQNHLFPPQLALLRNPRLIVVSRDPVAIAARAHLSDPQAGNEIAAFENVSKQIYDLMNFVRNTSCPALLLSYEKFLVFPTAAIDAIAGFVGIEITEALRAEVLKVIAPNNLDYIKLFHHNYRGHLDSIREGHVVGWCWQQDQDRPVEVAILANGARIASVTADLFREDLKRAGIGQGTHGFDVDISGLNLPDGAIISAQSADGALTLNGSNRVYKKA